MDDMNVQYIEFSSTIRKQVINTELVFLNKTYTSIVILQMGLKNIDRTGLIKR